MVLVVTLGSRTVEGAINAAIGFVILQEVLKRIGVSASWEPILFGLGAITYAKNPEGILEAQKRRSNAFVQRQLDRFKRSRAEPAPAQTGTT